MCSDKGTERVWVRMAGTIIITVSAYMLMFVVLHGEQYELSGLGTFILQRGPIVCEEEANCHDAVNVRRKPSRRDDVWLAQQEHRDNPTKRCKLQSARLR